MSNLTCEKTYSRSTVGKAAWDKAIWEKKFVGREALSYRCDRPAKGLKVSGVSFAAFAELYETHKKEFEHEGFKIEVIGLIA